MNGLMEHGLVVRRLRLISETIVLAMACISPWAIGSVDARAELGLAFGLLALAIFHTILHWNTDQRRQLACWPSLALAGLVLLALAQVTPLPVGVLKRIAPATHYFRSGLAPGGPQGVSGDSQPAVALPPTTLSLDPDATTHVFYQLAASWVLFQVTLGLSRGHATVRRFGLVLAGNATLLALFSLVQSLTWSGKIYEVRPSPITDGWLTGGPFVCHNHLAACLNLGLGFALSFLLLQSQRESDARYQGAPRSWRRYLYLGAAYAAGLILVGILGSHSRGGFLAMTFSAAITLVLLRPRTLHFKSGIVALLLLVALFLIVLGTASPFQRLATILDSNSHGYTMRFDLWCDAIRAWRDHPLWGTGLGSFPAAAAPYLIHDYKVFFSHAEDEYLQVLIEAGVIGFALVLIALAALVRLGRRAYGAASSRRDRFVVSGVIFGGLALAFQSVSDFPMHIPAIAVSAVILVAHLCRLGLEAEGRTRPANPPGPRSSIVVSLLAGLGMIGMSLAVLIHEFDLARAEILVVRAGIPVPGAQILSVGAKDLSKPDLEKRREALVKALCLRPNWAEGHCRLGNTLLSLYELNASEWIGGAEGASTTRSPSASPLWLHAVVHSATPEQPASTGSLIEHEPIRDFLVPAARSFLEARRSCPVLALPHVRLASLDYLLERGEPTAVHVERVLRLAGSESCVLALAGMVAVQSGDRSLAARCWKRFLEVEPDERAWERVAIAASVILSPDQILDQVLPPGGRHALRFADWLYNAPEDQESRKRFLEAALKRLPEDSGLARPERLWLEAQIRARLGDRDRSSREMEEAIGLEPRRSVWRQEYIEWLLAWGDAEEAHRQALIGTALDPGHGGMRRAAKLALDALARKTPGA